jgi:hypothetical protein
MFLSPKAASLLDVAATRVIALAQVAPLTTAESIAIADAAGRVAAVGVLAASAMPVLTNFTMDGFALSGAMVATGPQRQPIVATIAAGGAAHAPLSRIRSGAFLPARTCACQAVISPRAHAFWPTAPTLPRATLALWPPMMWTASRSSTAQIARLCGSGPHLGMHKRRSTA